MWFQGNNHLFLEEPERPFQGTVKSGDYNGRFLLVFGT
jgi:hypothetical protein